MNIQKEREAFEKWFRSLNENGRTTYFLGQEHTVAWEAWQAAKSHSAAHQSKQVIKENVKKWLLNPRERVLTREEGEYLSRVLGMENTK